MPKCLYQSHRYSVVRGFTMIELMVVVAILGVLASAALFAAPGFIERSRIQAAQSSISDAVNYARSEAVRLRARVLLQQKTSVKTCRPNEFSDTQNWSCGWTIFADINANNTRDATEPVLLENAEFQQLNVMHVGGTSHKYVAFIPSGYANNTPGRFVISPQEAGIASDNTTTLCVARTARVRVVSGSPSC